MERRELTFRSGDSHCAAWLYEPAGSPSCCVAMAHGFSLTRHDGLPPHAERLAAAGAAVLVFDHRYLGDSGGEPRQRFRKSAQREDWRDHFGAFLGEEPQRVAGDQIDFLRRKSLLAG